MNSLRKLDRAAGFLFWALLLPPIATNLAGFAFGVTTFGTFLVLWEILKVAGACLILPAIMMLVAAARRIAPQTVAIGTALIGLAGVELILCDVLSWAPGVRSVAWFWFHRFATLAGVLLGAHFLRSIARHLGEDRLAKSLLVFMLGYIVWQGVEWVWIQADLETATQVGHLLILLADVTVLFVFPGVWGLILLHGFRKALKKRMRMVAGECVCCGYPLIGLPEPRCPECGRRAAVPSSAPDGAKECSHG